jgi:serine 3-dehydrogenase (NADP+)
MTAPAEAAAYNPRMVGTSGTTRTAFVTGATSGIGEATARRLAALGWRIVACGRRRERLDALAGAIGSDRLHPVCADVRDAAAMDSAIATLPPEFAGIDLLVNNAGLALGTAPAQSASLDDWRTMIDTNVTALVTLTRRLLPALIASRGIIVNISSTAATYPYPGGNVYGGSKAFVRQFSLGLRSDLHGTGVRVTSLEPGMARTEFSLVRTHGDRDAADALYRGWQPMTADDIADTIAWIAQLPAHVNINRLEMMPTAQSFAGFQVARGEPAENGGDEE